MRWWHVEDMYAATYPRLVAALTLATGSRSEAEDLVQEALPASCRGGQRLASMKTLKGGFDPLRCGWRSPDGAALESPRQDCCDSGAATRERRRVVAVSASTISYRTFRCSSVRSSSFTTASG